MVLEVLGVGRGERVEMVSLVDSNTAGCLLYKVLATERCNQFLEDILETQNEKLANVFKRCAR